MANLLRIRPSKLSVRSQLHDGLLMVSSLCCGGIDYLSRMHWTRIRANSTIAQKKMTGLKELLAFSFNPFEQRVETSMEFDDVVVGAGSGGCVLAARLSEDPSVSVCLLEWGEPDSSGLTA